MPKQYGMVVDLQKCVGCGACALACKTENNTQGRNLGQTFNWADFVSREEGVFPNPSYTTLPVRCNHCSDPECIKPCPKPQALYKTADGLTLYNYRYCIQCKKCQEKCPYSAVNVDQEKASYSVISFNEVGTQPHPEFKDQAEMIKGCTSSGAEMVKAAGALPPYKTEFTFKDKGKPLDSKLSRGKGELMDVRADGWVEKCTFCVHRIRNAEEPACVTACPAKARVAGDISDSSAEISQLLAKHKPMRLKNNQGEFLKEGEKGTQPNMYYIRSFKKA